jgi:hypothetical protein
VRRFSHDSQQSKNGKDALESCMSLFMRGFITSILILEIIIDGLFELIEYLPFGLFL